MSAPRQPQIGDVWADRLGNEDHVTIRGAGNAVTPAGMGDHLRHSIGADAWTLVGRVVPVDHHGIAALRFEIEDLRNAALDAASIDDAVAAEDLNQRADLLADLLAILEGGTTPADQDGET